MAVLKIILKYKVKWNLNLKTLTNLNSEKFNWFKYDYYFV
jgi:hypothetical protein